MNAGRALAWVLLGVAGLVVLGMGAIWLVKTLLGLVFYLAVGAGVVIGATMLYRRAKRALTPGSRTRLRLEAASETYRQRNR